MPASSELPNGIRNMVASTNHKSILVMKTWTKSEEGNELEIIRNATRATIRS